MRKGKTLKHLEENKGKYVQDLRIEMFFFFFKAESETMKIKIDKFNYIRSIRNKYKHFKTMEKITNWEEILQHMLLTKDYYPKVQTIKKTTT